MRSLLLLLVNSNDYFPNISATVTDAQKIHKPIVSKEWSEKYEYCLPDEERSYHLHNWNTTSELLQCDQALENESKFSSIEVLGNGLCRGDIYIVNHNLNTNYYFHHMRTWHYALTCRLRQLTCCTILDGFILIDKMKEYTTIQVLDDSQWEFTVEKLSPDEKYDLTVDEINHLDKSFIYPKIIEEAIKLDKAGNGLKPNDCEKDKPTCIKIRLKLTYEGS